MVNFDLNALKIAQKLRNKGYKAYYVGGCVRDVLLNQTPKDIDISTDADPHEVEKLFSFTIPVGKQFGVIIVVRGKKQYEVATFRKDEEYTDGRHPSNIQFSTEKEDVLRRDFTINGLLFDPFTYKIIDYVGGQDDLKNGIIRTIGDPEQRFQEDKLRLIRGVRFAARFEFTIEDKTFTAIRKMAHLINQCSAERIRDELIHIFTGKNPDKGLDLLDETCLLKYILPEVESLKNIEQPEEFHPEGDVFTHTRLMLSYMKENPSKELAFGVLLHDIGKPLTFKFEDRIRFNNHAKVGEKEADKILKRLKFSNQEQERILDLVGNHMRFMHVQKMRMSKLKRFLRDPFFPDHLELHRLDCIASHGGLDNYNFCVRKLDEFTKTETQLRPQSLITGKKLISMGLKPGPDFKKILTKIEDLQLEGKITSQKQAIEYVIKHFL